MRWCTGTWAGQGLDTTGEAIPGSDSIRQAPPRRLWQSLPDGLLVIDTSSRIRYANPALAALFGHAEGSLLGQPLSLLQPERLRLPHAEGLAHYTRTGRRRLEWSPVEAVGLHADGHEFPIQITLFDVVRDVGLAEADLPRMAL